MYTKELKEAIKTKLLNKHKTSTNSYIYIPSYIEKNNLKDLILKIKEVTKFLEISRLDEQIYCILNNILQKPKCLCGCNLYVKFKRFRLGYANYASVKCRANDPNWQNNVKFTNLKKYGVQYIAQLPEERIKRSKAIKNNRKNFNNSLASIKRKNTINKIFGIGHNPGWNEKGIITRINNKNLIPIELKDEYRYYSSNVNKITKKQNLSTLENIEKRGPYKNNYHVDHMVSIFDCFLNDVPEEIAGNICNLQCIPSSENSRKRNKSSITINELYERYKNLQC